MNGVFGNSVDGQQVDNTSSEALMLALILGALQALVALGGGGGGGGGNVTIIGTTPTGNTTSTSTVRGTEGPITVTAGALSFEMILSSDFKGTINGAAVDNTSTLVVGVYRLDAPPWKPLAAIAYTITAGSAIRTVQT